MSDTKKCQEYFLDEIVSVALFSRSQLSLPVPPNLPFVRSLKVTLPTNPLLVVSYQEESPALAAEKTITAKYSFSQMASGKIYTMNISATIEQGFENVEDILNMEHRDYIPVLTKADGSKVLVYTLPNTCNIQNDMTINDAARSSLNIQTQAVSPFIELT